MREAFPAYKEFVRNPANLKAGDEDTPALAGLYVQILQPPNTRTVIKASDAWPQACNNAFKCVENLERLADSVQNAFHTRVDVNKQLLYPEDGVDPDQLRMFNHTVQNLSMLSKEVKEMLKSVPSMHPTYGIPKCAISALKVHLAPALEPLSNLDFNMSERDYQDYQVNDVFAQNFMAQIRVLLEHIRGCFIPAATDAILEELIQQLCSRLEKEILHKKRRFSLFGALQFDADIRALLSFFISIAPNIAVRQKFQRLSQICTLLSLEQLKELKDFLNVKWLINNKEIREVLILRFPAEAVDSELNYIMK